MSDRLARWQSSSLDGRWLDRFDEFVEYCGESQVLTTVGSEFVATTTQVLDESVTTDYY